MKAIYFKIYKVIPTDRIFLSFYYLRIILILLLILNCTTTNYESPCNPASGFFQRILQVKAVLGDTSTFCGISSATLSRIFTNGNNSAALSLTAFNFTDTINGLSKTYTGTITGTNITIDIPYGKTTSAIPSIVTNAITIQAGTTTVVSGVTALDFTSPITFTLISSNGSKLVYTVTAYSITPVADTGQPICFNYGSVAACSATAASFPNQDGELINFPNAKGIQGSSTNSGYPNDPINKDVLKGIVWKTCTEGQTGLTCTGTGSTQVHSVATTLCNNLNSVNSGAGYAGLKNWRLPDVYELNQLLVWNGGTTNSNFWDTTLFPNAEAGNLSRWTSSLLLPAATNAMTQTSEYIQNQVTSTANRVHCVSGPISPVFDMVDNGDGTILDKRTKLIWQKCALGQTNDASCNGTPSLQNWSNSLLGCKNLVLAGKSWRLPNANEMITLIDVTISTTPRVNAILFPNFGSTAQYDTSSTNQANVAYAHVFDASGTRFLGYSGKGIPNTYNSRCVAGPE